jgi:hypothetical protein
MHTKEKGKTIYWTSSTKGSENYQETTQLSFMYYKESVQEE